MKKLISIGLLLVFLFNVVGYRIFFFYLEKAADSRIEARINAVSHLEENLITVKIPIKLPYQTDWKDFERTDGEVTVNGKVFRYVKQKVYKDTLILLCLNFQEKSDLVKHRSDYFKQLNDLASDHNKKPTFKQAKADYYQESSTFSFEVFSLVELAFSGFDENNYPAGFLQKVKMPPRLVIS